MSHVLCNPVSNFFPKPFPLFFLSLFSPPFFKLKRTCRLNCYSCCEEINDGHLFCVMLLNDRELVCVCVCMCVCVCFEWLRVYTCEWLCMNVSERDGDVGLNVHMLGCYRDNFRMNEGLKFILHCSQGSRLDSWSFHIQPPQWRISLNGPVHVPDTAD